MRRIIGAAIAFHRGLGPGLTEQPYQEALLIELSRRGLKAEREILVPLYYRGEPLRSHYRLDLVVESVVVIEVKAVEAVIPYHRAKLLSCLRAARKPVGLLLNFGAPSMRSGIARVVHSDAVVAAPL